MKRNCHKSLSHSMTEQFFLGEILIAFRVCIFLSRLYIFHLFQNASIQPTSEVILFLHRLCI